MPKHLRSERSRQRRDARQFIFSTSYQDRILAETVCTVNTSMVTTFLQTQHEGVEVGVVSVEKGEVILDSRGHGSLQT